MASELRSRGLPVAAAARVLDSGLALRLTLWVRADGGGGGGAGAAGGGASPRGGGGVQLRRSSDASDGSWERGLRDGGASSSSRGSAIRRSDSSGSDEAAIAAAADEAESAGPGPCADVAFGMMLDDGASDLRSFGCFVRRASSHQFYSGRLPVASDGRWRRLEHVVAPCPPGFRRAVVLLRGRGAPGGRQGAVRFGSIELTFDLGGAE